MQPPFFIVLWKACKNTDFDKALYFHIKRTLFVYSEKNIMKTFKIIWIFLGMKLGYKRQLCK